MSVLYSFSFHQMFRLRISVPTRQECIAIPLRIPSKLNSQNMSMENRTPSKGNGNQKTNLMNEIFYLVSVFDESGIL